MVENTYRILVPKALVTKTVKSTCCSDCPVDQSNSLRTGSSLQDAQTPFPAAHRKRTCCSLRSETQNVCCGVGRRTMVVSSETDLNMFSKQSRCPFWFCYLNLLAVHVNHMDSVPVSHPQTATFGKAAADGLQRG